MIYQVSHYLSNKRRLSWLSAVYTPLCLCRWFRRLTTWSSAWSVPCAMWRSTSRAEALRWCTDMTRWAAGVLFPLWRSSLSVQTGETSARFPQLWEVDNSAWTMIMCCQCCNLSCVWSYRWTKWWKRWKNEKSTFLKSFFFFCDFQSGANQQFGEPGVWPGYIKERRRRRRRRRRWWWWRWRTCRQWRRGGPLPRLKPRQSIAG